MRFAAFLLALFCAVYGDAFAADVRLNWTPPTQNTDGTPVALKGYSIHFGSTADALTQTRAVNVPSASSANVTGLNPGTYFFCVKAISTADLSSACSNVVSKVIAPAAPNPPTGLTVQELVAYQVIGTLDKFVLLPVGTVAADTVCDTSQSVNGMFVVPREAVTFYGSVKPQAVVAKCG